MICEVWSVVRGLVGKSTRARSDGKRGWGEEMTDERGKDWGICKQKETIGGMIVG